MSLSSHEIARVIEAVAPPIGDAPLRSIHQPTPTEIVLELRTPEGSQRLLLSAHPRFSRLHRIDKRPPSPPNPYAFQMLLRKELSGRLAALSQIAGDRLVRLEFVGLHRRTLVAELTGPSSNILLLDEEDILLGALKPLAKGGRLRLRHPYVPPPPRPEQAKQVGRRDRFLPPEAPPADGDVLPYDRLVADWFDAEIRRRTLEDQRSRVMHLARRALRTIERRLEALDKDLERAENAERHRLYGDLIQIHLREIPAGSARLVVPNLFSSDPDARIEIPLDPRLGPMANAQKHYKRYRKYDASIPFVLERIEAAEQRRDTLLKALEDLEKIRDEDALLALEKSLGLKAQRPTASRRGESERLPYHVYHARSGREIWVGRSAKDNDTLTFRIARGNDFWLHVRGRPGAHVVIPSRESSPDLETLLEAGRLALKHSGFKRGEKAEVAYTRAKYVRKVKGRPGMVTISQERSLWIESA